MVLGEWVMQSGIRFLTIFFILGILNACSNEVTTREQCEAENEKLRSESMGAGQDQGMAAGTQYGGVGMAAGAVVGAAAGYAAGWWKGDDCEKYPYANK
jgi:hypothetical protein